MFYGHLTLPVHICKARRVQKETSLCLCKLLYRIRISRELFVSHLIFCTSLPLVSLPMSLSQPICFYFHNTFLLFTFPSAFLSFKMCKVLLNQANTHNFSRATLLTSLLLFLSFFHLCFWMLAPLQHSLSSGTLLCNLFCFKEEGC